MIDPYSSLGETLTAAARRRQGNDDAGAPRRLRGWLARRMNAAVIAVALVLGGGAIAVAATGLLNGSPVRDPAGTPTPSSGSGVPVAVGGSQLAAITADFGTGVLAADGSPALYVYEQRVTGTAGPEGVLQRGLIGVVRLAPDTARIVPRRPSRP